MTDSPTYDGSGKLGEAIAKLCNVSPKNSIVLTRLMKQAKDGLGITTKSKRLPPDINLAIWHWHYDRLQSTPSDTVEIISQPVQAGIQSVEIVSQVESVEIFSQDKHSETVEIISHPADSETVEIFSHPETVSLVEIVSQPTDSDTVELFSQVEMDPSVEIVSQPTSNESVELFSQVRIAFYTVNKGVRTRQVIALEGFYINALMQMTGIAKQDVPKWVQGAVDGWAAFDPALPITRQVKFLIIQKLTPC